MRFMHLRFAPITLLFFVILFYSCEDILGGEDDKVVIPDPITVGEATRSFEGTDEELWVYFERFEDAGNARNLNVDLVASMVTGSIADVPSQTSPGLCSFDSGGTIHHINITRDFWDRSSVTDREVMVFHELGHCFLERGHFNLALPTGICVSLMRDGSGTCKDNYNVATRDEYLDELFGL